MAAQVIAVGGVAVDVNVLGDIAGAVIFPGLALEKRAGGVVVRLQGHVAQGVVLTDRGVAVRVDQRRLVAVEVIAEGFVVERADLLPDELAAVVNAGGRVAVRIDGGGLVAGFVVAPAQCAGSSRDLQRQLAPSYELSVTMPSGSM